MSLSSWQESGRFLQFGDHRIFYRAQGEGPEALLCIHGFPTASWDWEPLWPQLVKRFPQVLAPDLLGFGFSDKPASHTYSILEQADLCEALLESCGVERVHLFAHDYGVSVAQELLAREQSQPRRRLQLKSIAFLNGGVFPELHRPLWTQRLLNSPLGPLVSRLMNERRFGRSFARVFGPDTQPGLIELHDFWSLVSQQRGHHIAHRLIRYIPERRWNRDRWVGALMKARIPIRLINGPLDPVSGAHMAKRFRELVPQADVVSVPGVGHYPQVEAPDRVLRLLLDFHSMR